MDESGETGGAAEAGANSAADALLARVRAGDAAAVPELFGVFRAELAALAAAVFRSQRSSHTLEPDALLNEAFLRIMRRRKLTPWNDKAHFFAAVARTMRTILVNHARDRSARKRGGPSAKRETLTGLSDQKSLRDTLWLLRVDLRQQLDALRRIAPEQAQVVEMRAFAGLTNPEIAEATGCPLRTVELRWQLARWWLEGRMGDTSGG